MDRWRGFLRAGHLVGDDKTDPQSQLIAVITTIHQTCLTTFALLAPDHTPPSRCFRVRVSARDTLCLPCRQTDWTDVMRPARSLSSFLGCAPLPRNRTRASCSPSGGVYCGPSSWQFRCSAQQGRLRRVQGTCPPLFRVCRCRSAAVSRGGTDRRFSLPEAPRRMSFRQHMRLVGGGRHFAWWMRPVRWRRALRILKDLKPVLLLRPDESNLLAFA